MSSQASPPYQGLYSQPPDPAQPHAMGMSERGKATSATGYGPTYGSLPTVPDRSGGGHTQASGDFNLTLDGSNDMGFVNVSSTPRSPSFSTPSKFACFFPPNGSIFCL